MQQKPLPDIARELKIGIDICYKIIQRHMATQDPDQIQLFKPRIHISSDMKKEMIHAFYGGLDNSKPPKMTIH